MEVCRTQKCTAACCPFGQPFKEHYMSSTSSSATENQFDIIVIGAGPVGEVLAQSTLDAGLSTAIVEHNLVGGNCAYYACKPSKALLRPVTVAATTQHLSGLRDTRVVADDLLARRSQKVSNYDDTAQKQAIEDRKSTRLNSSHVAISYAVFCLTKKNIVFVAGSPDPRQSPVRGDRLTRRPRPEAAAQSFEAAISCSDSSRRPDPGPQLHLDRLI